MVSLAKRLKRGSPAETASLGPPLIRRKTPRPGISCNANGIESPSSGFFQHTAPTPSLFTLSIRKDDCRFHFLLNSKYFLFLYHHHHLLFHGLHDMLLSFQILGDFPDIFLLLPFNYFHCGQRTYFVWRILLNFGDLFHDPEYGSSW